MLDAGRLSSTEEKHRMLGRCFGYFALARAGLLAGSGGVAQASAAAAANATAGTSGSEAAVISLAASSAAGSSGSASSKEEDAHTGKIAAAIAKDATHMAGQRDFMRAICGEVLALLVCTLPWRLVQRFLLGPLGKILGGKPSAWDGGLLSAALALEEAWEASGKASGATNSSLSAGPGMPASVARLRASLASDRSGDEDCLAHPCARAAEDAFPRVHAAWRRLLWRYARRGVLLPGRATGSLDLSAVGAAVAAEHASFRRVWGECVEERMMRRGNARERAAGLVLVAAALPLCPPGTLAGSIVWSSAAGKLAVASAAGSGKGRRGGSAMASQRDAGKIALEAVVKSATER